MVSEDDIVKFALGLPGADEREQAPWRIFSLDGKIFLCIEKGMNPVRLELRCDRKLSETLQERYESVMESRTLGRGGIEIICSGQLNADEVLDLVRHAYEETKNME